jgi:hypothetical protein
MRSIIPFRTRSYGRDALSADVRLLAVERAIVDAIGSAEREERGLKARYDDAVAVAAIAVGSGTSDYLEREPETERQLCNAEQTFSAAGAGLGRLRAHIEHLNKVLEVLRNKPPVSQA